MGGRWWLATIVLLACGGKATPPPSHVNETHPQPHSCAGSSTNCSLRYDQVTFAATHDAFSYASGGPVTYQIPNQDRPIHDQLAYGVRAFGIRPSPYYGTEASQKDIVYVTHNGSMLMGTLGQEPLLDILKEFQTFLVANPNEVVTLFAESLVSPQQIADVFTQAGLDSYLVAQDRTKPWPTLQQLIDAGTRLIVFNDSQDSVRPAWQMYLWDYITDTDYNITDKSQFRCDFYRGQPTNALYFINQFIYRDYGGGILTPDKANAQIANDGAFILERATQCWQQMNRIPNYIYVDWYGQGDLIGAVSELNTMPR